MTKKLPTVRPQMRISMHAYICTDTYNMFRCKSMKQQTKPVKKLSSDFFRFLFPPLTHIEKTFWGRFTSLEKATW